MMLALLAFILSAAQFSLSLWQQLQVQQQQNDSAPD